MEYGRRPWGKPVAKPPYAVSICWQPYELSWNAVHLMANAAEDSYDPFECDEKGALRDPPLNDAIKPQQVLNMLSTVVEQLKEAGWLIVPPPRPSLRRGG